MKNAPEGAFFLGKRKGAQRSFSFLRISLASWFATSADARLADNARSCLNSLNSAAPLPVALTRVTSTPAESVTVHAISVLKSVGGQVSTDEELELVVI